MAKKLTIQDIIAKKKGESSKERKTATVFVPSYNGEITVIEPSKDDLDRYDESLVYDYANTQNKEALKDALITLIYNCVSEPNLKDSDLQKALDVSAMHPKQIVNEVFNAIEIPQIGGVLLQLAGRNHEEAVRLVDDLKKE